MLRDVSDVRSLVFLAAILGLETLVVINFNNVPTMLLPLLLFVLMVAVFIATLINHNHRHLPMFHAPWANRLLNGALTIAMGAPSTRLHAVHMLNHHKHYRTTDDWSHYSLAGSRRGLLRTLTYYKNATMRMGLNRKTLELTPEAGRELRIEYMLFAAWLLGWLVYDFKAAAIVFASAYLGGQFILLTANLINHDHCDLGSPYNLARTFDSRWENWLFLNHGFHAVHHRRTTLHWSKLRQVHDSHFRDKTDPEIQHRSFCGYFLRHYILAYR